MSPNPDPQLRLEQVNLLAPLAANYLLRDISMEIFAGDRAVIIGPSGAGKTSLLRLLNRLSEPSSGNIYLEKLRYQQIPVRELRQRVMLVPQEPKLLGMKVWEAMAYPLVLRGEDKKVIQQKLVQWSEELNIPEEWRERTELQLSLGQRQLVAIARALVAQPQILLLDEPTSALDAGRAERVLSAIANLTHRGAIAVLMVTHQLDLAQKFCQRVLYLQNGQLMEDLSAEKVDWQQWRDRLVQAEAQTAQEWN